MPPPTITPPTAAVPGPLMDEARRLRAMAAISGAVGGYARQLTESTRLRQEWTHAVGAADQIQGDDRERIVAFSRRLYFQSPVAQAVIEAMVRVVVGEGIYPQGENDAAERAASAFWDWADTALGIDIHHRDGFGGVQQLWVREMLVGGDVLINRVRDDAGPMGIATQAIESERIVGGPMGAYVPSVSGFGPRGAKDGAGASKGRIVDGVELDAMGRAVRYHVSRYAFIGAGSSALAADTTPVDAKGATLLAHRTRLGQTRGLPYLTPAMGRLAGLEEYTGAVEVAAKLHAMVAIITKTMSPEGLMNQMGVGSTTSPETESASGGGSLGGASGSGYDRTLIDAQAGMTFALGLGEEVTTLSPSQPGQTHETFVRTTVAQVCAVLGIPIEVAMGDFSRANFSVARMALLLAEKTAAPVLDRVVRTVLHPVYRWWLTHAMAQGIVEGDIAELQRIRWRGPKRLVVDPQKEAAATAAAITANLTTYTEELDALGKRRDDVFAMRAQEVTQMRLLGITPPAPAGAAPVAERDRDQGIEGQGTEPQTDG